MKQRKMEKPRTFASSMDFSHVKNVQEFQNFEGRVVNRGDIVKDDSGSYASFTEQGSSASPSLLVRGGGRRTWVGEWGEEWCASGYQLAAWFVWRVGFEGVGAKGGSLKLRVFFTSPAPFALYFFSLGSSRGIVAAGRGCELPNLCVRASLGSFCASRGKPRIALLLGEVVWVWGGVCGLVEPRCWWEGGGVRVGAVWSGAVPVEAVRVGANFFFLKKRKLLPTFSTL